MPAADATAAGSPPIATNRPVESCVWCGSPLRDDALRLRGRTRCPACGAATTDPWPSEAELENAYGTWYRPQSGRRFSMIGDALLNRTRATLGRRLDAIAPTGRVLDVGAGDGTLIDALERLGRRATGLERDARHSRVLDQSLDQVQGEWAAVVFWHSLEHLPEPGRAIREAARLLGKDGVVIVAVPNTDSLQARAFGDHWLHLDIPRHLVHLSARSLTTGLERCGFKVERVSGIRGGQIVIGWLDGLVGSLPGGLNLYQALRRPQARSVPLGAVRRIASIGAGVLLLPLAGAGAALEIALHRSGTVYVEARLAEPGPSRKPKIVVVMPARQAAATLERTFAEIPQDEVDEVILVDDSSTDETVNLARRLPLHLIWHPHQVGYGGNQKTCYTEALQRDADVVVMLHPDGQYEPELIPAMVKPILDGEADLVLGSRLLIPGAALAAGMPRWKFLANRFLTEIENRIMGTSLSEAHTGYRAYSRRLLLTVPFLRNSLDFVFDSELLMQASYFGFTIKEVPARCRYFDEASSVGFKTGAVYGLKTLWAGVRLILHRSGLLRSRKFKP